LTKKSTLIGIAIVLLLMLCAAYSNHFTNGFQYDDTHAIVDNAFIRNIKNLPLFFTDIKYFGTNVNNQAYRPVLVSLNAIDYWLAGGLKPVYFHVDVFISYLVLLILLFLLFKNIFQKSKELKKGNLENSLVALLAVGFYGLHAANAETINYIVQRADSFSSLLIVASLLLYINPKSKKYYLYIITIALAIMTKEVGVITGGIIFFYALFFEENTSLTQLFKFKKNNPAHRGLLRALKRSLPALLFSYLFLGWTLGHFLTGHTVPTIEDLPPALNYYATEAVIFAHYLGNFILPVNLSISSGFTIFPSVINPKILFSFILLLLLIIIAFITSREKEKRPIAFGIVWFFLALVPSSFVVKSGELANDHRTFLPYIGLVMSLAWWLRLIYIRYQTKGKTSGAGNREITSPLSKNKSVKGRPSSVKQITPKNKYIPKIIAACYFIIISLHAYGTYQRNIVWSSYENLWHDAVLKHPDDYMASMNYGLVLLDRGKYKETLPYFERVLKLNPHWAYINVNMGVLKDNMGFPQEAEPYFQNAIQFQPFYPVGYYYYGRFLLKHGKKAEAIAQLEAGLKVSPGDEQIIELLNTAKAETPETKLAEINKTAIYTEQNPTANNYLSLSVLYYQNAMYKECIEACDKALKLDPLMAMAYNNICASYNSLGLWEKAEEACKKSLQIDSTSDLAKANLNNAQKKLR